MNEQRSPEQRCEKFVVTKSGFLGYWVRENDGSSYWPNRGLFLLKFLAVRRAKALNAGARLRGIPGGEYIVWGLR